MTGKGLGKTWLWDTPRTPYTYTTMAVLAASICTRGGKGLLSRQFCDLSQERVTALVAGFPKLAQAGSQHTVVDDEMVRYVYQPIEELYVLLITDKQSNILQDIGTLRLLAQLVSDMTRNQDEREVMANAFEILCAFDEVITQGGYRENVSASQVMTFLEMESHEEKIQEIIEKNKEMEAAEERKRKAKQLEMQRREMARRGGPGGGGGGGMGSSMGMGSGGFSNDRSSGGFGSHSPGPMGGSAGMGASSTHGSQFSGGSAAPAKSAYDFNGGARAQKTKGLQLGAKKAGGSFNALKSEAEMAPLMDEHVVPGGGLGASASAGGTNSHMSLGMAGGVPAQQARQPVGGVEVSVLESVSAKLRRDGSVETAEVKGNLNLRISDPAMRNIRLLASANGSCQYKTHPNVDRAEFLQNKSIGVKDASRPFPANGQEIGVLRWKLSGAEVADQLPLSLNCWFTASDPGFIDVTLEYELNPNFTEPLDNVVVRVPLVSNNAHVADPSSLFDQSDDTMEWMIPDIQPDAASSTGSFSFTAEADSEDNFFPMEIQFRVKDALQTYGKVDVMDVVSMADENESLPFTKRVQISSDGYVVV